MINLPTKAKIVIAKVLYNLVKLSLLVRGKKDDKVACTREGINWQLDLDEGIDLSIYVFGRFEKSSYNAIKSVVRPDDVVLDIGANIGAHTLPLGELVQPKGKVVALEATNWAFDKLKHNLSLNPRLKDNIVPVQTLLTDQVLQTTPVELYSSWNLQSDTPQHGVHQGTLKSTDKATVITIDELVEQLQLSKIDFVKMDVDGFECKVLRGAKNSLEKYKPKMLLELCPYVLEEHGDSFEEMLSLLYNYNYQLFSEDGKNKLPKDASELRKLIPKNGGINALAIPV